MAEGDSESDCPICFDTFRLPKILPCGHTFCFQCLKEYSDEKSTGNVIICPLCRTQNTIPNSGLNEFVTNYFVQNSKPDKTCLNCKMTEISTCCTICFSYLCAKCYKGHVHSSADSSCSSDDEDDERSASILLNPSLLLQNVRTKYICKVQSQFVVEMKQDELGRHIIYSLCPSISGGILITPNGIPYILQVDQQGNIKKRIRIPFPCTDILEFDDGSLLATFGGNGLILKYMYEGWTNFASCPDYFPLGITTLSNGNIAACGVNQMLTQGNLGKARGHIQVYSPDGEPIRRLDKFMEKENVLAFPFKITACKEQKTIAVLDQENSSIVVFQEEGNAVQIYRGTNAMLPFQLHDFGLPHFGSFRPLGICCSLNGLFFVSVADGSLHILDHSGKFCGLALTNGEDGFGSHAGVRQDQNGTIWCSDSQNGMIRTFRIVRFQNDFKDAPERFRFGLG